MSSISMPPRSSSPDFKQQYSPASYVPSHGRVLSGKEEFINMTKQISKIFDMKMQPPLDMIHGVDKVVFHLMCDGKSKSGSGKEFHGEYMLTFHFDGEKIVRINEFVDTKYNSEWFGALRKD
ncbi:hypothetical protein B0H11DRAFT_2199758 [Mycena galericulata]|nr:hypothetical protein B0H11DRAFT_2199758 [Mycena galericulata]